MTLRGPRDRGKGRSARSARRLWSRGAAAATAAAILILTAAGPAAAVDRQGTFELSASRYGLSEPLFKTIYQPGGMMVGLGLSAALAWNVHFYAEARGMAKTGALTYSKERTDLFLLPVSIGLRYVLPLGILEPFLGGGLDYFLFYENNPIGTTVNHARGWHIQGGTYLRFGRNVPVLLVAKFKFTRAKAFPDTRPIQLGGFEAGGGLAFSF